MQAGKGPQSTANAMKSALQGPQNIAPATKSALQGRYCAATKSALQGLQSTAHEVLRQPRNLRFKTQHCACHEIGTSRSTKHRACHAICTSRSTKQITTPATKFACRGAQSTACATISENEPHVQKSRCTAPATKSEHAEDHHHVQSTAPATKLVDLLRLSRKVDLSTKTRGFPCACHEK